MSFVRLAVATLLVATFSSTGFASGGDVEAPKMRCTPMGMSETFYTYKPVLKQVERKTFFGGKEIEHLEYAALDDININSRALDLILADCNSKYLRLTKAELIDIVESVFNEAKNKALTGRASATYDYGGGPNVYFPFYKATNTQALQYQLNLMIAKRLKIDFYYENSEAALADVMGQTRIVKPSRNLSDY